MAGKSPQGQLAEMNPEKVRATIHSLRQLYDMGKPETNAELKERIDMFFEFCETAAVRPGIEVLCTACHISRTTLFRWSHGIDCDEERQEIIETAKNFINSFLEQVTISGQVSPPVGIFLMKNWLNYKDLISVEQQSMENIEKCQIQGRTPEDIAKEYGVAYIDGKVPELPEMPDLPED